MSSELEIFVDGACRGNPGDAAVGFIFKQENKVTKSFSKYIGEATNNVAEYTALIYALQQALMDRVSGVKVYTDSELMQSQITGRYKIKDAKLKFLFGIVQHLIGGFTHFEIQHVLRDKNYEADKLASSAIDAALQRF